MEVFFFFLTFPVIVYCSIWKKSYYVLVLPSSEICEVSTCNSLCESQGPLTYLPITLRLVHNDSYIHSYRLSIPF